MSDLAVLIPVYSNQAGLAHSLGSLAGAAGGFDVLVVDDGSPTPLHAPERLRGDVPVSLLRLDRNHGIAGALNQGLRRILAGEYSYVARLDAGDTIRPSRFQEQVDFLETHSDCAVISSFVDFVDGEGKTLFRYRAPIEHPKIVKRLRLNNCIVHASSMMRTSSLREVGLYREDVPGGEDYELFLRAAGRYTVAVLPEFLTRVEYSARGLSVAGRRQQQRTRLKLQFRYFDPRSFHSYFGVLRTCFAMIVPQPLVLRAKVALAR